MTKQEEIGKLSYIDIDDFEIASADLSVGDSIFEELAIKTGRVPCGVTLVHLEFLHEKKARRYFYRYN